MRQLRWHPMAHVPCCPEAPWPFTWDHGHLRGTMAIYVGPNQKKQLWGIIQSSAQLCPSRVPKETPFLQYEQQGCWSWQPASQRVQRYHGSAI